MAKQILATETIGNHTFTYAADVEAIREAIEESRKESGDGTWVPYGKATEFGDKPLTEEQYQANVDELLVYLERMVRPLYMERAIENASRKKNGTFYKGRIYNRLCSGNCGFFQEWHNTWTYDALTVRAVSDTELELTLDHVTDTPG